jgi:helicase
MGINTPASSVVIAGLTHPGPTPYSVAEYKNLVGRAGRLGFTERGASYLVAMDARDADDFWRGYVTARPEDLESRFFDAEIDPRSLIVRVLVAGGRAAGGARGGMRGEQIATFLEASFGAFQQEMRLGRWSWSHDELLGSVEDLARHGLIEAHEDGRYELTPLGRLAGESGTQVGSIIRLVDCLRPLRPEQITDPTLIASVQVTQELDQIRIPLNRKTPKEAQSWLSELARQGVPQLVLQCLGRDVRDVSDQAARAKRAVAALAYVSGQEMSDIERLLARHGVGFDGAAGPVRGTAARTCDLLGVAARAAEILQPELRFGDRIERLSIRLTLGISPTMVDLARYASADLTRGDYRRLAAAGLHMPAAITTAGDEDLLVYLDGDRRRLNVLRSAAEALAAALAERTADRGPPPQLAAYSA